MTLSPQAGDRVRSCRRAVDLLVGEGHIVYGITTGFGAFKDRVISTGQTAELQRNLLMSHAVGVGEPLSEVAVRAMMVIRANALAKGY